MTNDITAGGGRPVSDASFQCILESKYAVINILRPLSECEKLLLAARLQRRVMTAEVRGTIIMEAGVRMCPVIVCQQTQAQTCQRCLTTSYNTQKKHLLYPSLSFVLLSIPDIVEHRLHVCSGRSPPEDWAVLETSMNNNAARQAAIVLE